MRTITSDGNSRARQSLSRNILAVLLGAALLLLVPLVAMQFTNEVKWDLADFLLAGLLLLGTGFLYVFATAKLDSTKKRALVGLTLALALFLVWVELAVGIVGS